MAIPYYERRRSDWGLADDRFGRRGESSNEKPIIVEYGQTYIIEGQEYRTIILFVKGKVYWNTAAGSMQIISASFTGWSPKQATLYVKDIRKNMVGGIGLTLNIKDLEQPLAMVSEYNRMVGGGATSLQPKGELDDYFQLEDV